MTGLITGCYDVIEASELRFAYYFWLCDDNGFHTVSLRSNFSNMKEVRDERLNELGL